MSRDYLYCITSKCMLCVIMFNNRLLKNGVQEHNTYNSTITNNNESILTATKEKTLIFSVNVLYKQVG